MRFSGMLSIAMSVFLCLAQCGVSRSGGRQASPDPPSKDPELPAPHLQTLRRILPQDFKLEGFRSIGDEYEVTASCSLGTFRVWLDAGGFPLVMREDIPRHELPLALEGKIPAEASRKPLERHWLILYEIDFEPSVGGEEEIFYDGWGRERFRIRDSENDRERTIGLDEVPDRVKRKFAHFLQGRPPERVKKETEWGRDLIEVAWRNDRGWNELKLLASGEVLFWELPHGQALPESIGIQVQDEPPELLLLAVYCLGGDGNPTCWLPDGTPFPNPSPD